LIFQIARSGKKPLRSTVTTMLDATNDDNDRCGLALDRASSISCPWQRSGGYSDRLSMDDLTLSGLFSVTSMLIATARNIRVAHHVACVSRYAGL
jgi:hypothetical protein